MLSCLLHRISQRKYAAILLGVFLFGIVFNGHRYPLAFMAGDPPIEFKATEQVLMRKPFCKIMFYFHETGWGLRARALPACKYWALQNGATQPMKEDSYQAIRARKPDFFLSVSEMDDIRQMKPLTPKLQSILKESGYRQCYVRMVKDGKTLLKPLPVYAKE